MRHASLLLAGASLAMLAAQAPAQEAKPDSKTPVASSGKDKAPPAPPAVAVVPPAKGSGAVSGPVTRVPIVVPIAPVRIAPAAKLPAPPAALPAPPAAGSLTLPFHTTTAALSAVGRGHHVAAAAFTPVRIVTAAVGAVGRGPAPAAAPFEPVRVRTAPLGAVGRPAGS